jgi:hypothetical protein
MKLAAPDFVRCFAGMAFALGFCLPTSAVVTNLVWYRLGENDPGAALGVAATNTFNLLSSTSLKGLGGPLYTNAVSADASNDVGSTLAVEFSGSSQYFTNAAIMSLTNNFGIEAWVNPNSISGGTRIIAYNGNTSTNGWGIYQSGSNFFGILGGKAVQIGATTGTAMVGTWTHVALVRSSGTAALFINGVLSGSATNISPLSPGKTDAFAIGAIPQALSAGDFNGRIDEVRIFFFSNGLFRASDLLINLQRVTTQPGVALSISSAALNGTLETADLNTSAWFEWGADTNYGNTTAVQSVSRAVVRANFTDSISNLMGGVTYQFRAVVSNALGVAYGANLSIDIPPAQVTSTNDNGPGSLRELVSEAGDGETITFAPGLAGIISTTNGPIEIDRSLNIIGTGPKFIFLSSANHTNILQITGGNVMMSGLTITLGGDGYYGYPAINNGANLTVTNCEFNDNSGTAINHYSNNLVLLNCSFLETYDGGALVIASNATASATNCTFAGNSAINAGGAIFNQGVLTMISCTVAFNSDFAGGGGIYSTGMVYLGNCVLGNDTWYSNTMSGYAYIARDVAGNFTSLGYNFIGSSDGSTGFTNGVNHDQVGSTASPLTPSFSYFVTTAYNGGQTMNVMPMIGSPLIDQGNSFGLTTDQRGFARTVDFSQIANPPGGDGTDIGAVEYGSSPACADCATQVTIDVNQTLRPADSRWFGANTVAWKSVFDSTYTVLLMREMGCTTLRFPGGSYADTYHWNQNSDPTKFGNFMHVATNVPTPNVFITVNYGTGTSNEAAGWVANANITNQCGFKYWEVGNENYYSGEADQNTNPPYAAHDAWTYAMRFCDYYHAMKAVDPTIKVGAVAEPGEQTDISFHYVTNPRTGISHNGWMPVMLTTLKTNGVTPDFIIRHFYPEYVTESDPELLQAPVNWAFDAAEMRQEITDYFGSGGTNIELVCTENNADSDYSQGRQSTSLVNGIYLADSMGHLMQTEFNSWLWWLFQDGADTTGNFSPSLYGWRTYGDFGLTLSISIRYPTFYAFKLMHDFVQPGDTILDTGPGHPFLDVFAVTSTNGVLKVLVINKDPTNTFSRQITLNNFSPDSAATVCSYGMPQDDAAQTNAPLALQDIATNQMIVARGGFQYSFPPYSLTMFTLAPTGPSLAASRTTPNTVTISWPWPSTGWNLQQNTDLTTTNWTTPPETIQNDGTNNFIIITSPVGNMFFRLVKP